jgi:hypothetical protein
MLEAPLVHSELLNLVMSTPDWWHSARGNSGNNGYAGGLSPRSVGHTLTTASVRSTSRLGYSQNSVADI